MSNPIGKFVWQRDDGSWAECQRPAEHLTKDFCLKYDEVRFLPYTGLDDANGELWYEGDEGWVDNERFVVVLSEGAYWAKFENAHEITHDQLHLVANKFAHLLHLVADKSTHTPPVKKYKRKIDPTDVAHHYGMGTYEVDEQRKGERREKARRDYDGVIPVVKSDPSLDRRVVQRRKMEANHAD